MGKCGRGEGCDLCVHEVDLHKDFTILTGTRPDVVEVFFFHEYGRRVGMVPRSSLKGGKKQTDGGENNKKHKHNPKTPKTTTKGPQPSLHHHVVFSLC